MVFDTFAARAPRLSAARMRAVHDWIVRTANHRCKQTDALDCRLFMDMDMAVLARQPLSSYAAYAAQTRAEYRHHHTLAFNWGRSAFLHAFAKSKEPIYTTPQFAHFEAPARANASSRPPPSAASSPSGCSRRSSCSPRAPRASRPTTPGDTTARSSARPAPPRRAARAVVVPHRADVICSVPPPADERRRRRRARGVVQPAAQWPPRAAEGAACVTSASTPSSRSTRPRRTPCLPTRAPISCAR